MENSISISHLKKSYKDKLVVDDLSICVKKGEVLLLEKSHFKYEYKHITYEKSGHMLTVPFQSIYISKKRPYDIENWAKANVDCWNETIKFLEKWASR